MVARPGTYQASVNALELAPEMHGRTDIKQFYAGLALALNIEAVPQGGGRLSARSRHLGRVRNLLQFVPFTSSFFNPGPHSSDDVVYQLNFAGAPGISTVIFIGLGADQDLGAILQVEWFDGTSWSPFAAPFSVNKSQLTRTVCRPPREQIFARAIRLRLVSAPPSPVNFVVIDISAHSETGQRPVSIRVRPFTFALDQTYTAVIFEGHIDFYRDGIFVGGATTNFTSSQIAQIGVQQRFDTMLLFHEDQRPCRILRNSADNEWVQDYAPLTNIPIVDLGGTYSNQVVDIWQVYLRYPTTGSNFNNGQSLYLTLNINGEETSGLPTGVGPDWTAFKQVMKAAIEALPSQQPGVNVVEDHSTPGLTIFIVSFLGAETLGQPNTLSAQVVNTSEAAATATHTQFGVPGGEDLFSNSAGWPACGNFYQERLVMAGFKAKRSALLGSVTGDYFNDDVNIISPSGAILANLDTNGAERLHHLAIARHLVLFTTDAEYFISDRALNRTVVPTIVNCSRNGSAPTVPIVESEGSLLYVARDGNLLFAATYDDVSQAYLSQPLSLLASHISSDVVDQALQKPSTDGDAGRLWQVRADGTMCLGIMLRNQDVTGFARWQTLGKVMSVCVDGVNIPHVLVERSVGGLIEVHLERLEHGLMFDDVIEQTFSEPVTTVAGLDMHEGVSVWAMADGYVEGPFTVALGAIELPNPSKVVQVGRWTPPRVIPLPLASDVADHIVLKRPKRVHTVRLDLLNTTSIAVGANGRSPKDVALYRAGDAVDAPLAPFSGEKVVSGLTGFSQEGQIEITQLKPGLLQWSSFTREART